MSPNTSIRRVSPQIAIPLSCVLGIVVMVVCVGTGPIPIPPEAVLEVIGGQLGLTASEQSQLVTSVVWELRVPRILFGAMTGAALATAGAAMQSLFNNPLADPGVVGVSAGASTGAAIAIVAIPATLGSWGAWAIPAAAFLGGLAVTALIYLLARPGRTTGTSRLLLVGIALGSGCVTITGLLTYVADDDQLQTLVFWQMGSLGKINWTQLLAATPAVVAGLITIMLAHRWLDLLTLGEREAQHLGLQVSRARAVLIITTALLTGAVVSFAGTIGFVGLVVPHIVRMIVGPRHGALLPMAAIIGAILIMVADSAARTIAPPAEVPVGLFTAALGAPFFLFLVIRTKRVRD